MNNTVRVLAALIIYLGLGTQAYSQDADLTLLDRAASEQEEAGWSGAVTANYYERRGNAKNQDWGLQLAWAYQTEGKWLFDGVVGGMSKSQDNTTTDESYKFHNAAKYFFTKKSYGVGRANYDKDRFSGIKEEAGLTGGYGRELFKNPKHKLIGEAGAGVIWTKSADDNTDTGGVGYGALLYNWKLTDNSSFSQLASLRYSEADSNWRLHTVSQVKATIIGSLAGKFSYEIQRNSEVPDGSNKTDYYTTLGLEYSF